MTARAFETSASNHPHHRTPARPLDLAHWMALVAIAALVALAPVQASAQTTKKPTNGSEDAAMPPTPEVQAVIEAHPNQHLVICLAGCGDAKRAKIVSALPAPPVAATPPVDAAAEASPVTPVSTTGGNAPAGTSLVSGDATMLPCVAGCGTK